MYACTLTGDVDIGLQADQLEATKAPLPVVASTSSGGNELAAMQVDAQQQNEAETS